MGVLPLAQAPAAGPAAGVLPSAQTGMLPNLRLEKRLKPPGRKPCEKGGDGPGVAPAVAMEHRQSPEIDWLMAKAQQREVADGVQIGAAMVVDHALRGAGGAGGVVQRDRIPFVPQGHGLEMGIALLQQCLVVERADQAAGGESGIVDMHDERGRGEQCQCGLGDVAQFAVHDEDARVAMGEDMGDGRGVQAGVDGVEHGAQHRHAVMRLQQGGHVGGEHGDGIAIADAALLQRGGQAAAALGEFAIGEAARPGDDGDAVGEA